MERVSIFFPQNTHFSIILLTFVWLVEWEMHPIQKKRPTNNKQATTMIKFLQDFKTYAMKGNVIYMTADAVIGRNDNAHK